MSEEQDDFWPAKEDKCSNCGSYGRLYSSNSFDSFCPRCVIAFVRADERERARSTAAETPMMILHMEDLEALAQRRLVRDAQVRVDANVQHFLETHLAAPTEERDAENDPMFPLVRNAAIGWHEAQERAKAAESRVSALEAAARDLIEAVDNKWLGNWATYVVHVKPEIERLRVLSESTSAPTEE